MAAKGLDGIWGLQQLDRTGLATSTLTLVIIAVATLVGGFAWMVLAGLGPNPVIQNPPEDDGKTGFGLVVFCGLLLSFLVLLARLFERDLHPLAISETEVQVSLEKLTATPALRFWCVVLGLPYGLMILFISLVPLMDQLDMTVVEMALVLARSGGTAFQGYVLFPFVGVVTAMVLMVVIGQVSCLLTAARSLKVNLLMLDDYAALANPGVRLFLVATAIISLELLVFFLMIDGSDAVVVAWFSLMILASVVVLSALIIPYGYPVWVLRNRIREAKLLETSRVKRALQGDVEAVALQFHGLEKPATAAEVLMHQMFLESRWEWPIASHVQKLILFGLLPPLSWVLAAIIENTIY